MECGGLCAIDTGEDQTLKSHVDNLDTPVQVKDTINADMARF